jgi:hypothetical protein
MNTEQPESEGATVSDDALAEWRKFRGRGHHKPGAGLDSREAFKLSYIDDTRDDRGTRIPLAEEDETDDWTGRGDE